VNVHSAHFIGGQWREAAHCGHATVENPATEEALAQVPSGDADDVDAAVLAAAEALPGWSTVEPSVRLSSLARLRDVVADRADQFAETITDELGCPTFVSQRVQVQTPLAVMQAYLDGDFGLSVDEIVGHSRIAREPVGVVAAITPWNYPLHQVVAKVFPALLAGCTVVLKPAELTPLTALQFAAAVESAGLPPGVFNVVLGTGDDAGAALVAHPLVDMVTFTGSTEVGKKVGQTAVAGLKRISLELGGKSAALVLDGSDVAAAVRHTMGSAFLNSGQTCSALTRLLVPRSLRNDVIDLVTAQAPRFTVGDPRGDGVRLGPLASRPQRERVESYIRAGLEAGARPVVGGLDQQSLPVRGHYVAPTVLADVDPDAVIAREEIFGPVLVILAYDDVDDAVAIANRSDYGLYGSVWGPSVDGAVAVARRLQTGSVEVNGGRFNPAAPFGGRKKSGIGRELGRPGLEEFFEYKSLHLPGQAE
jgi:aldehyde dehydrogenase (NAD+)